MNDKLPIHHKLMEMADHVYDEGAFEVALLMRAGANELIRLRKELKETCEIVHTVSDSYRCLMQEVRALRGQLEELTGNGRNNSQH